MAKDAPVRFGAEFGPASMSGSTKGVGMATFKRLVWISNLGGLLLVAIALEMMIAYKMFITGVVTLVAGVIVALFPSNFEIAGMDEAPQLAESEEGD